MTKVPRQACSLWSRTRKAGASRVWAAPAELCRQREARAGGHSGGTREQGSGRCSGLGFTCLPCFLHLYLFFGTVIPLVDFNNQ